MPSPEVSKMALHKLGSYLSDLSEKKEVPGSLVYQNLLNNQQNLNRWFIPSFIIQMVENWAERLSEESIRNFVSRYPALNSERTGKHVALIPDENIPIAGLHELMCVLLAGHHFYARNINHRSDLLQFITGQLIRIEPEMEKQIHWVETFPKSIDSFLVSIHPEEQVQKSYFLKKNSLIREKRSSLAILSASDGKVEFRRLAEDIFLFFGQSCHSVRKIFVPKGFSFQPFFEAIEEFSWIYQHNKYANNYDYHQSVFLMERIPFLDNGFLIVRESSEQEVPLGCLYYECYDSIVDLKEKISRHKYQDIATSFVGFDHSAPFGNLHHFGLWDYEDHKDIIKFLTN